MFSVTDLEGKAHAITPLRNSFAVTVYEASGSSLLATDIDIKQNIFLTKNIQVYKAFYLWPMAPRTFKGSSDLSFTTQRTLAGSISMANIQGEDIK